jgi:predicted amidohydrolase YtcJ
LLLQRKIGKPNLRVKFTGANFFVPQTNSFLDELHAHGGLVATSGAADQEIDLGGGFVFPAFRDGHAHPLFAGREAMGPVVTNAKSIAEIQEILRGYRTANPEKAWIEGGAYDRSIVDGGLFLASWIDEAISDVPVVLHASDHHTIWVNSKALELIPQPLPLLTSGSVDLNSLGLPQGVLREPEAMALVLEKAPVKPLADEVRALTWADQKLASYGIVQAQDAWITPGMTEVYLDAVSNNLLLLDYNLAFKMEPQSYLESIEFAKRDRSKVLELANPKLSANTVKFFADGVFGSGTAAVLDPYLDQASGHGEPLWSEQDLREATLVSAKLGFQLHIHAIGDAGVRQALDAIEFVQSELGRPKLPSVIAHAELISDSDIPRFAALGVVANMQPLWAQADGMLLSCVPRLGQTRIDKLYRMRDLVDSGAVISFGSDWPVSSSEPMLGIATAVTRQTAEAEPQGGWTIDQALNVVEAMESYSQVVSYQLSGERVQALSEGSSCDFVVLDKNPLATDSANLRNIKVLKTFKAAKLISEN